MFGNLETYRSQPIPDLEIARNLKKGYREWPIDFNHFRFQEACQDIHQYGVAGQNHYYRSDNAPYYQSIPGSIPDLILRTGVIERLTRANEQLMADGLELFIHDGWRPAAVQIYFHDFWFPAYLRGQFYDWSEEEIMTEVEKYWARGSRTQEEINPISPPPHATGAAVDLTIRHIGSDLLWMGTIFDDVTIRSQPDFLEYVQKEISFSDDEARKNRRLLYWVMIEAGFVVNPTEWWHFSWGDQMWAKLNSADNSIHIPAWYSVVNPIN